MVAVLLLKMHRPLVPPRKLSASRVSLVSDLLQGGSSPGHAMTHRTTPVRHPQNDGYRTIRSWKDVRDQSPTWVHPASSPVANFPSVSLSSMSSRGSWSSLFNTSNVRQLIGNSLDAARDSGHTESAIQEGDPVGIPVPGKRRRKISDFDSPRARPAKSDSPQHHCPVSRFDVGAAAHSLGSAAPIAGQGRRPTFSQIAKAKHTTAMHKSVVFVDLQHELQQEL
jgi:hypothetical protein